MLAERERIAYQSAALTSLGSDRVLRFISTNQIADFDRFREVRLSAIERSMLLCGCNVELTHRGSFRRFGFLLVGLIARHTIGALKTTF